MSDPPAEAITDFNQLHSRQVAHHTYLVLNLSPTPPRAYEVDLSDPSCTCPDHEYNIETHETCKHLAYALFQAPATISVEEELVNDLSLVLAKLEGAAQDLTSQAGETTTMTADEAMAEADETADSPDETEEDIDLTHAADRLEAWLETAVPTPEHVEMWIGDHGDRTGIVVQPANNDMADHAYEAFKGVINSIEDSEAHVGFTDEGCQTCGQQDDEFYYWVPGAAAAEVGGDG
jgi:uncharacterized Zn finger protein